jgi:hypothetical protein
MLKTPSRLLPAFAQTLSLFVSEIFLVVNAVIINEPIVLGCDFLSRSQAGARFRLVHSGHGRLRSGRLWVLLLRYGVAGIYPVEVYVHGLSEI